LVMNPRVGSSVAKPYQSALKNPNSADD
jgi:hypothetical protein